jgi:hypothetical protein
MGHQVQCAVNFISVRGTEVLSKRERAHLAKKSVERGLILVNSFKNPGVSSTEISESCRPATMIALRETDFAESGVVVKMKHLRNAIIMVHKMKRGFLDLDARRIIAGDLHAAASAL